MLSEIVSVGRNVSLEMPRYIPNSYVGPYASLEYGFYMALEGNRIESKYYFDFLNDEIRDIPRSERDSKVDKVFRMCRKLCKKSLNPTLDDDQRSNLIKVAEKLFYSLPFPDLISVVRTSQAVSLSQN